MKRKMYPDLPVLLKGALLPFLGALLIALMSCHKMETALSSDELPKSGNAQTLTLPEIYVNDVGADGTDAEVLLAVARDRTHGGALVCVAVLRVDIVAIHAAPPNSSAT